MKRNEIVKTYSQDKLLGHKQCIAFHEAGHAAGIYLNIKARCLPPVFFKIIFKDMSGETDIDTMAHQSVNDECIARVEGGRLIELIIPSIDSLMRGLTECNDTTGQLVDDYMIAMETDIINLLIGPLAEAKFVAETDDEQFNYKLVNLKALINYGGSSDLALVNEYLQSFSTDMQKRDKKLEELFIAAYNFINNDANWLAITKLADYILSSSKSITCCEEVVSILDQSIDLFQSHRIRTKCGHG